MDSRLTLAFLLASVTAGLLLGRWLYALWLAHESHDSCPRHGQVLEDAKRVRLDIDDLTMGRHAHG